MPQPSVEAQAERLLRDLQHTPPSEEDHTAYKKALYALYDLLFEQNGLTDLGALQVLDGIVRVLRHNEVDSSEPDSFQRLEEHCAAIRDAHAKLATVLDTNVGIRDVLYLSFDSWPQLQALVGCAFSSEAEQELQTIRLASGIPSERLRRFVSRYFELLEAGAPGIGDAVHPALTTALGACALEEERATVHALFADPNSGEGRCFPIHIDVAAGTGDELTDNTVGEEMKMAARRAVDYAFTAAKIPRSGRNVRWSIEEATRYEGSSIGLAVAVGTLAELCGKRIDCYTAFTGTIHFHEGRVGRVEYVREKLQAAEAAGVRRVFLPKENLEEAEAGAPPSLSIIGVNSVDEAWSLLTARGAAPPSTSREGQVRHFELECEGAGLRVTSKEDRGGFLRLKVTDYQAETPVDLYRGKKGLSVVIGGRKDTPLYSAVRGAADAVFGTGLPSSEERKHQSYLVRASSDRVKVAEAIRAAGSFDEKQEANCDYRLDFSSLGERVIARQFTSGTLTIHQTMAGPADDPLFADLCRRVEVAVGLPPQAEVPKPDGPGAMESSRGAASSVASSSLPSATRPFDAPWIGTDEAGKGDYLGPLVSAGVYVDDSILEQLAALGVRDSKLLSDKRVRELAEEIKLACHGHFAVVEIHPERYNQRYDEFRREGKTLNALLAWSHTRALENLFKVIECDNVIVDQFVDVSYVRSRLLAVGRARNPNIVAMPRAEANLAVAAASILARDRFLAWRERAATKYSMTLPKGASEQVIQAARVIVQRFGRDELAKVAKLHFKTTANVLGGE